MRVRLSGLSLCSVFVFFLFDFAVFYVPVFFVSSPNIRDKRRESAFGERTNTIFIFYSLRMRYVVSFWKPLGSPYPHFIQNRGKCYISRSF